MKSRNRPGFKLNQFNIGQHPMRYRCAGEYVQRCKLRELGAQVLVLKTVATYAVGSL